MIYLRTAGDPAMAVAALREQVHSLNRDLPVYDIRTMEERMRESTGKARFSATLLTVFAGIALLLSAVGIYGVMAYLVTQRTREIGIRMALGARPGDVLGLMLRRGAMLAAAGVAIGTAGALGATRVLTTLLYEVRANDARRTSQSRCCCSRSPCLRVTCRRAGRPRSTRPARCARSELWPFSWPRPANCLERAPASQSETKNVQSLAAEPRSGRSTSVDRRTRPR
jgi:ABC-type antimicrobial peptide transport system permease subunit